MRRYFLSLFITCTAFAAEPPRAIVVEVAKPSYSNNVVNGITMQCVTFDSRSHCLRILDQPNGPASLWATSQAAAQSVNGLACVNAGFFTPQGSPLGVVISHGKKVGANNPSSLGSSVWYEANGRSAIIRREKCNFNAPHLLQAGPMLTENAKAIAGLDNVKTSARVFIAWDGGTNWIIARTSPCSLHHLSQTLAQNAINGFKVRTTMNLDGGRSADLYVSNQIAGGPVTNRPIWNNPVRNFLVLQAR
jgi:uncharacterized protein YigE (DUF2233 family)